MFIVHLESVASSDTRAYVVHKAKACTSSLDTAFGVGVVLDEVWMHGSSWLLKSSSQMGNFEPGRCTCTRGIPGEFCFVLMGSRMSIPADEP